MFPPGGLQNPSKNMHVIGRGGKFLRWGAPGHQNGPKDTKKTPREPKINVLGSKNDPKMAIVTPFQKPTSRSKNTIVPPQIVGLRSNTDLKQKCDSGPLAINATNGTTSQIQNINTHENHA